MNHISQNTLTKLQALLDCTPEHCLYAGCVLYNQELKKCEACRAISLIDAVLHTKFEKAFADEERELCEE